MLSIIYYTAALTSLSDNVSYIAILFSEWRIELLFVTAVAVIVDNYLVLRSRV